MKKLIIFCAKDGRPSMLKVYGQMRSGELQVLRRPPNKKEYIRAYKDNSSLFIKENVEYKNANDSVLIRWGNRVSIPTNNGSITYNRMDAIENATLKSRSREIFIANGVSTALLVKPESVNEKQFPVIARPHKHSKGKNFIILKNIDEFAVHHNANNTEWYYSEFINKTQEYRVHCAHGKVLAIMEKPAGEGVAWNRAQSHESFTRVKQENYNFDVCLQALNATKVLGLDFAGVDVIVKDAKAYVLEANTSPTLNSSDYVSSRYASYFDWLGRASKRLPHYNFAGYTKVKSFAWTNNQLNA